MQWARVFSRPRTLVGLDIGSSAIKIVQLEQCGTSYRIQRFGWRSLEGEGVVGAPGHNPGQLKATLIDLIRELELFGSRVVMSVSGPSVMVKRIRLTGVKKDALDEYLTWEGHQYIPYAMRDIYFDYWVLPPSRQGTTSTDIELLLVAAKQQVVENRKTFLKDIGVHPIVCDVDGLALMNMVMGKSRALRGQSFGIVNVGASGMNMVFVGHESPLLVRDVSFDDICPVQAVDSQALLMEDDAVHGASQGGATDPCAPPVLDGVVREVQYCLESVMERYPEISMEKIFLCGGHSKNERLHSALQNALSLPTIVLNPFDEIEYMTHRADVDHVSESAHLGGVALGLALHQDGHGRH